MIELTERQALLCERALELIEGTPGGWAALENDINEFSGEKLTEQETEALKSTLRNE